MFARCLGVLFGLWGFDDAFAADLFDDMESLSSRNDVDSLASQKPLRTGYPAP